MFGRFDFASSANVIAVHSEKTKQATAVIRT